MVQAVSDRIAIILVNYKGASDTIECLESIRELNLPAGGAAVYVVENASPDDSLERLREWLHQARTSPGDGDTSADIRGTHGEIRVFLLRAEINRGFAAGCNLGLGGAYRDPSICYFWLLNNDTVVDPAAALELLACSRKHEDRSICGSTLLYYDDSRVVQAAAGAQYLPLIGRSRHVFKRKQFAEIARDTSPSFDYIIGASMFFSRSVLDTAGYLPERYFLYVEEADWCARARRCGISLDWARGSLVLHKEGRSTGADARFQKLSDDAFYYVSRNNLLFLWQRSRLFVPTALAYCLLQALSYRLKGDRGKLDIVFRAYRDFWRLRKQTETLRRPSQNAIAETAAAVKSSG
ncbi:MAG TPA: glycosyltransferase family 2 protein [Terracidiphilus sp.]|jgi:hypothetical protein|nr:glycosyltransferase family 2 protein [Terracidiphilus sp.]